MEITTKNKSIAVALIFLLATIAYILLLVDLYGGISGLTFWESAWPLLPYIILLGLIIFIKASSIKKQSSLLKINITMAVFGIIIFIFLSATGSLSVAPFLPLLVAPVFQFLALLGGIINLFFIDESVKR